MIGLGFKYRFHDTKTYGKPSFLEQYYGVFAYLSTKIMIESHDGLMKMVETAVALYVMLNHYHML